MDRHFKKSKIENSEVKFFILKLVWVQRLFFPMKKAGFLTFLKSYFQYFFCQNLRWVLGMAFGLSLFAYSQIANADTSAQVTLTRYLQNIKTYSANFTQVSYDKQNQMTQRAQGLMAWEKPNLFLWKIQSDPKQTVILKQNALWIYDPDLSQLSIRKWKPVQDQVAPVLLLNAPSETIARHFEVKVSNKGAGQDIFNLMAKDRSALFYLIQLVFKKGQLIQMNLYDALSGVTQIQLTQVRVNQKIDANIFNLHYPPSTDVIDERKKSGM